MHSGAYHILEHQVHCDSRVVCYRVGRTVHPMWVHACEYSLADASFGQKRVHIVRMKLSPHAIVQFHELRLYLGQFPEGRLIFVRHADFQVIKGLRFRGPLGARSKNTQG